MIEKTVWDCKIGFADRNSLPGGADNPMRKAVESAFYELTKKECEFCFSGWGGDLTEFELACVEDRKPDISNYLQEIIKELSNFIRLNNTNNKQELEDIIKRLTDIAILEKLNTN